MAEDDEIDILGDFNLDSFLNKNDSAMYENTSLVSQNSELLNCDYTIHPQWLLDKPSANPDCWYDTNSVLSAELPEKSSIDNGENLGHVSTENSISDESGWTEKEKNLLERGIEIFGKSNIRLSQFIGSRTPSEVKYYLKNFYFEVQSSCGGFNTGMVEELSFADVLDETQIPASIEEVIAAVSTAKPTVAVSKQSRKKSNSYSNEDEVVFKDMSSRNNSVQKTDKCSVEQNTWRKLDTRKKIKNVTSKSKKDVKFKIKTQLKFPIKDVKQKKVKTTMDQENKQQTSKAEITTGKGLSVPICEGEEIVKISKDESDSDLEIDIENPDEIKPAFIKSEKALNESKRPAIINEINPKPPEVQDFPTNKCDEGLKQKSYIDLSTLNANVVEELMSLEEPKCEVIIGGNFVSELEKVIHTDFFEGRPTKTPMRYLKIRNHILESWSSMKPTYVTKTSIRPGLKNCGDVNCISRIHCYLEQTGAINFGCPQTCYVRPLYDVFQALAPNPREKPTKDVKDNSKLNLDTGSRQRIKRKFANDGEGGYTLTHNEKGDVINTTIVSKEPAKPKVYIKKQSIILRYCRPFPEGRPQKFKVKMHLTTLLLMDFHAHTSLTEVMGLVAGSWDPKQKTLTISHYEPCRNLASSTTHCDMCPISQSEAAEKIHNQNLDILGWFHSHPTFAPEPSQQDLETQQDVQLWIGTNKPCLGVILSPFSSHGALIASPFRCMVVHKKDNCEDQFVPYKFHVDVESDEEKIEFFLGNIKRVLGTKTGPRESKVNFQQPYFQDVSISFLEKYITSVRMHIAKCGTLNKMTCDYIIDSIINICSR